MGHKMPKSSKNNASRAATAQINAVPEASKHPPEASKMPPNGSENGLQAGLRVEYRPLDALIPFARNPRAHSDDQVAQIAASIREFGFTNPILLDGGNGVIAGHGRLAAARQLGLQTVPCIELGHLTEEQKRAYVIADNKLALNAGWNEELLRLELTDLKEMGANLQLIGFDAMELADIMMGKDIEFKEYDESAADDVQLVTCPKCGHSFPK
jgi:ParB-like chromosome segregation protein Spo0J